MSTTVLSEERFDHFSDWMNPILVKETRQALKSRSFVATFMLLLIASWLICLFGIVMANQSLEYGSPSRNFLMAFFFVLSAAVTVIVPFGAFRSLANEQDGQTYELLSITSLTPRQIVLGKLFNSIVQILVYYSAIAPFIAFTSLLQGFDLFATVMSLLMLKGVAILLCTFTLMLSTVARNKQIQAISSIFVIGGLITGLSIVNTLGAGFIQGEISPSWDLMMGSFCVTVIGISYLFLFLQITISQLLFDSGNKATGVRLIASLQPILGWLMLIGVYLFTGRPLDDDLFYMAVIMSLIHLGVFSFFASMERDELSRRIRRDLPRNGFLRMLLVPFMPGGTRGYLFFLMNLLSLGFFALLTSSMTSRIDDDFVICMSLIAVYMVIFLGIGSMISRFMTRTSTELKPMHARTVLIIIVAFCTLLPHAFLAAVGYYSHYNAPYHPLQVFDPISTINAASSNVFVGSSFIILGVSAIVVLALNIPSLSRAVREVLVPKRPVPRTNDEIPAQVAPQTA